MKAEQSSLYRQFELFHLWCLDTFENAPRNMVVQKDIDRIMEDVIEAAAAVAIALQTEDVKLRLDYLDVVVLRMTEVKFLTKGLTEYSANPARGKHVISKSQRTRFLDLMTQIGIELGRWRNATVKKVDKIAATLSD